MLRLAAMLYSIIGSTLASVCVVVALVAGFGTLAPLLGAAAVGFVVAVPVSVLVAKALRA